jgi:hypothetical protein
MEPTARVVEAIAEMFEDVEASPAPVEAARYSKETSCQHYDPPSIAKLESIRRRDGMRWVLVSIELRGVLGKGGCHWPSFNLSRGRTFWTAPLRSPLRARVVRRADLASIVGKVDRDRRRGCRNGRGSTLEGGRFGGRKSQARSKALTSGI